jgi:hypothetical protein
MTLRPSPLRRPWLVPQQHFAAPLAVDPLDA